LVRDVEHEAVRVRRAMEVLRNPQTA
jgi:hypothetical protein